MDYIIYKIPKDRLVAYADNTGFIPYMYNDDGTKRYSIDAYGNKVGDALILQGQAAYDAKVEFASEQLSEKVLNVMLNPVKRIIQDAKLSEANTQYEALNDQVRQEIIIE